MVPPRQRLARTLTIVALTSIVSVALVSLSSCGGSDDEEKSGSLSAGDTTAASESSAQGSETTVQKQMAATPNGSKHSRQAKAGEGERPEQQGEPKQPGGHKDVTKGTICPDGMSRAECRSRIEAQTEGPRAPSTEVTPSTCTDVMTAEQCEEIVRAQKAAEKEADKSDSVSPETCLEEYSREFCEERFGEQAEQQAGQ
jgi:hypothetical protein